MFKIKAPDRRNNLCGTRIAEIRKAQKLSQRKLAAKCNWVMMWIIISSAA